VTKARLPSKAILKKFKMNPAGEVNAGPSPLAVLRALEYPFPASEQIAVADKYDGYAVLWKMDGLPGAGVPFNPHWVGDWFKIILVGSDEVELHPPTPFVVIVDFKDGFDPTPDNLHYYVHLYLMSLPGGHPLPGDAPIITK
jgi:hypothetical protein